MRISQICSIADCVLHFEVLRPKVAFPAAGAVAENETTGGTTGQSAMQFYLPRGVARC